MEVTEDSGDDSMGILGGGNPELRMVPLGPLRKNLAATVDALQQVFADVAARGGTLPLAEAQLSLGWETPALVEPPPRHSARRISLPALASLAIRRQTTLREVALLATRLGMTHEAEDWFA